MALLRSRTLMIQFVGETRGLTGAIKQIEGQTTALGKIEKAGKAAFTALALGGAAVAGGLAFSVKAFADFDAAMNESLAIMDDVTDKQRNDMANAAREVSKSTTFSAKETASAYYFLASAGLDAEQSIAALPQVAMFAQAGMMDLERATELVTTGQTAMGLTVDDAAQNLENMTRVTDVLTKANNLAQGSVEQFAEALTNKAAGAMRDTGVELEEGVAVLAAFAEKGVMGKTAGEQLAILLRDVTRAAVRNKDAFADLGIEVFDSNNELKNIADVVEEFEKALGPMSDAERAAALEATGMTRSVGGIIRTLMGSSDEIRAFELGLSDAGNTTEEVANKQLQTFNNQLTLLKNKLMDVAIEIGSRLVPKLMPLIDWVNSHLPQAIAYFKEIWLSIKPTLQDVAKFIREHILPALRDLAAWFKEHPKAVVAMGAIILGVLVALAFAWVVFKTVAIAQMILVGFQMAWLAARALAMGFAMAIAWLVGLGPIAILILAIIALGVVIFLFWEDIKKWAGEAWTWIQQRWDGAVNYIMSRTEGLRNWFHETWDDIRGAWDAAWDTVADRWDQIWSAIEDRVQGAADFIGGIVDSVQGFIDDVRGALDHLPGRGLIDSIIPGQHGMVVPRRYAMGGVAQYGIGGIAGDTVPAILKPGEMVLNRRQQTSLFQSLNRGGWRGSGGGDTYVVEIYNPIGAEEDFTRMVVNAIKRAGGQGRPITIRGRQL